MLFGCLASNLWAKSASFITKNLEVFGQIRQLLPCGRKCMGGHGGFVMQLGSL